MVLVGTVTCFVCLSLRIRRYLHGHLPPYFEVFVFLSFSCGVHQHILTSPAFSTISGFGPHRQFDLPWTNTGSSFCCCCCSRCWLLQVRLPYAVLPDTASAQANSHDGTLFANISVDKSPPSRRADAGSKPWLLSSALEGGPGRQTVQAGEISGLRAKVGEPGATGVQDLGDALPEDRFHLKLPAGSVIRQGQFYSRSR